MICTVSEYPGVTEARISAGPASDVYFFRLSYVQARWEYVGKLAGASFISNKAQGYEHIPQEFWAALDAAWIHPSGMHEFPDPLLDDLEVAGT